MQTEFTPLISLAGGALIGLAAVLMMATNGRIAGVSGIISRLLPPRADGRTFPQGLSFVIGMLIAVPIWRFVLGADPEQLVSSDTMTMAAAGLLVGFGSVLGSGCTSGHGVCGISRLSMRSIAATLVFMGTGFITVYLVRHVFGG